MSHLTDIIALHNTSHAMTAKRVSHARTQETGIAAGECQTGELAVNINATVWCGTKKGQKSKSFTDLPLKIITPFPYHQPI